MNPPKAFRSILFPVDFSEMSGLTASHVKGLAEIAGATVTLLHVIPWLSAWYDVAEVRPAISGDYDLQNLEGQARTGLERFRDQFFNDMPVRLEVVSGGVAETIVDTAASLDVDLIMMPTRGLGRSRAFLIGSTTAKVLHDAHCAIWTSPHLSHLRPFAPYRNILCAVDREDVPAGYLEEVARVALSFDSKLSFISAIPSMVGGFGEEHRVESLAREFPQAHIRNVASPSNCMALSKTGSVGDVVKEIVETHQVDLVIANRGHLQHPLGRFCTHAYEIVLESPCPVLSLFVSSALPNQVDALSYALHDASHN